MPILYPYLRGIKIKIGTKMKSEKEFIDDIKHRFLKSDKIALNALSGSLSTIKKMFPYYGSFIMEFIQNADDAGSSKLLIELKNDKIIVANNGNVFSKKDIESICSIGRSSKKISEYIGYLGVGFKSIFLISDGPEIYSGKYSFGFKKELTNNSDVWQIIPNWIENNLEKEHKQYDTIFNIPLRAENDYNKIQTEINEHLNNRMILFLRNLKTLIIHDYENDIKKVIQKVEILPKKNYSIFEVSEKINGETQFSEYWLLFREIFEVPEEIRQDPISIQWGREDVIKREVIVAFSLKKDNGEFIFNEEIVGTLHIGVYSFLPIKEVESGLPFIIQADFLTNPGRTDLSREALWNIWLSQCAYKMITEKCIPVFLADKVWKFSFFDQIYSYGAGHEVINRNIKEPLRDFLEKEKVLISDNNELIPHDDGINISINFKKYVKPNEICEILPNKKIIHHKTAIRKVPLNSPFTFNASSGLSDEFSKLLDYKASKKDLEFFKFFYNDYLLNFKSSSNTTIRRLKNHSVILTEKYNLVNSNEVYLNTKNIKIPSDFKDLFDIINPKLLEVEEIMDFLVNVLNINEITDQDIEILVMQEKLPELQKNWTNLNENQKIKSIIEYKLLYDDNKLNNEIISSLQKVIELKSKTGKWIKPQYLIFPKVYEPNHILEELLNSFSKEIKPSSKLKIVNNVEFVSDEYLKIKDEKTEINTWYDFFRRLGVDQQLETDKSKFSDDIAMLTTMYYEKTLNCRPDVKNREYDIQSNELDSNMKKDIEVKGRSNQKPHINITNNEYNHLIRNDNSFLYVVSNVFLDPLLEIVNGKDIGKITEMNYNFEYHQWNKITNKEINILKLISENS